nr:MAG TPA: PORTAL PROTEIN [Caudoviricetes sp.]
MQMVLSAMDRINMILQDPEKSTMTLAQIVSEEIREFKRSEQYKQILEAEGYYRNRSSVQGKTVDVAGRSNAKIERPILKRLVDQKANYLLSKPWTISTENKAYSEALSGVFDQVFRRKIKSLGKGAVKSGIAWLQPYFDDAGGLAFMRIPSTEVVPLWRDSEHTKLDAFIRFYDQIVYVGVRKHTITHAEFWWPGGVRYFKMDALSGSGAGEFQIDKDHGSEANDWTEPHFSIGEKAYNWDEAPIIWLKYNEEELPLCYFIRDLIDDINWQNSVTADVLRDVAKFIYVLKNYGGADLAEFIRELKENMAIKVDGDGGVDKLQADMNIDAVMAFLDNERRDIYDYAAAVDTKDPDLGNASGTAINFRYMDLDTDCASLGDELQDAFRRLKLFLDVYFQATEKGDFTGENFDIVFNMDLPANETDIINNARNSDGLISKRTILKNHPWVTDVDEELDQIDKEKKAAMEDFGEGLFDDTLGAGNGPQAPQEGQEGAAGKAGGLNGRE